ncbi:MAG: RluA family pseudouridine synthase [Bacteroidia bacterium]|nr:RluA family pseudouridine synthase [Bacteroidia bacterium]
MKPQENDSNSLSLKPKQSRFEIKEPDLLIKFLRKQFPGKGSNKVKSWLEHKKVAVNNKTVTYFNFPLEVGNVVTVTWITAQNNTQLPGLKILYEDNAIIVIDKEAGLLSIATDREKERTAYGFLSEFVKRTNPRARIFVVHRLDRETSGVMIFAKSEEVKLTLQENWQEMVKERTYAVVVEGEVEDNEGTMTSWLKENKAFQMYSQDAPSEDAQEAITHYKLIIKNQRYSLLNVQLETGRKNQIRVHFNDLGFPVVGDRKYGALRNPLGRLGLHAKVIEFLHPVTNNIMRFESPVPKEFLRLVEGRG